MIQAKNLSFAYDGQQVLKDISLQFEAGKVTTLLGPNGSGKTTLLKLILGLLKPDTGEICIDGRSLSDLSPKERAQTLAYVPQKHVPAFAYRVLEIVIMGRHPYTDLFARTAGKDVDIAISCLDHLHIAHLAERPYTELSGGEQQLVLIARALAQQARVLILDEPVSGLDYGNQVMLLKQLRVLANEGLTCINTSHFPEHALWTSDAAMFIDKGQIIASGATGEVINENNLSLLYRTPIKVIETSAGGMKTCVPDLSV